ncbi:MAG: ATP-binding cassette domain-containing protein [Dehalococcoidia bacterium]|nr:ATP-binding cassette domain-containing protein [Dehalococcoidia bacterium]
MSEATIKDEKILEVEELRTYFPVKKGIFSKHIGDIKAVDGLNFFVRKGETLGLVGESGCGKSTTGRSILQLIRPTSGSVKLEGTELTTLDGEELRSFRRRMQMVFQDPYSSFNPRMSVADIVSEPMMIHGLYKGAERDERVTYLLESVGLNPFYAKRFPHEFSGGQRQRIGIARALASEPDLIICDEPVAALDVSIQAQVINLLEDLQLEFGLTLIFIAHDLAVVRHISDRVAVMYLGHMVELATSEELYKNPKHAYTKALLSAIPIPDPVIEKTRTRIVLEGDVPSPFNPPEGCIFASRNPSKQHATTGKLDFIEISKDHWVSNCPGCIE